MKQCLKRIFILLAAVLLCAALCSCGKEAQSPIGPYEVSSLSEDTADEKEESSSKASSQEADTESSENNSNAQTQSSQAAPQNENYTIVSDDDVF